jgi:hypothetical protein
MTMDDFLSDIPTEAAYAAHAGTSFVPGDRAKAERSCYAATLTTDLAALRALAGDDQDMLAVVADEFERYRDGYRRRFLSMLGARSRIVSTMIAGGSNFPVARMNKRNETANRRTDDLIEFRKRAMKAIRGKLCPGDRPIMAGDVDAVERLQTSISEAEALQDRMKRANVAIRKNLKASLEVKLAALVAAGFSETIAAELLTPDCMGSIGFPDYRIRNNNANIRRMKVRLSQVERAKARPATETVGALARVEDCPTENRVRVYFPGKPDAAVRTTLKGAGFRWAPSLGCWQAHCNERSRIVAAQVANN